MAVLKQMKENVEDWFFFKESNGNFGLCTISDNILGTFHFF